jgi:4-hydroxybenzoate polyprenyltransferase
MKLGLLLENVKFEHTVFALPFAYLGMVLAAGGLPTWHQFFWITVAMVAARTLAMSLNRVIDRRIDALNPRTARRPIPSGRLSARLVWLAAGLSLVVLTIAAWMLNDLCLKLLPIALLFLIGYHHTKRFTPLCHFVLGIADGGAPIGGWVAVSGTLEWPAIWLGIAVAAWVAGFDLIYCCQDVEFDRAHGLHSIAADYGIPTSLALARICHVVTLAALAVVGLMTGLGPLYWVGWLVAAGLLAYEHSLVSPTDLSRLDAAFFNVNGYLGLAVFAFTLAAVLTAQ